MNLQTDDYFLHAVVLNGLIPLANERTLQSFYYVLKGRKSNQTYQDTHIYSLFPYYRLFPSLTKELWEEIQQFLLTRKYIQSIPSATDSDKATFLVTENGVDFVSQIEKKYPFKQWLHVITNIRNIQAQEQFWMRVHLMSQTISQLLYDQRSFFPVVTDKQVQNWVKSELSNGDKRAAWFSSFSQEIYEILFVYPSKFQRLLIEQLSGYGQVGQTLGQIAMRENEPELLTRIQFRYILSSIMRDLSESEAYAFPLLRCLAKDEEALQHGLSSSAAITLHMIRQEHDIEVIAKKRGLRKGTIEDHLVEIILNCPEWDGTRYVTEQAKHEIITASHRLGTKRLRVLREYFSNQYSYLQIRLALAQMKENA